MGKIKAKDEGQLTLFGQLFQRTHLMSQNMSPLKQSATEVREPGH